MREYETIFVTKPDGAEEDRQKLIDKISELISKKNGEISKNDDWGVKRLAYPIKKYEKGRYTYLRYTFDPAGAEEIERTLRIDENVLRHLTVLYEPVRAGNSSSDR